MVGGARIFTGLILVKIYRRCRANGLVKIPVLAQIDAGNYIPSDSSHLIVCRLGVPMRNIRIYTSIGLQR